MDNDKQLEEAQKLATTLLETQEVIVGVSEDYRKRAEAAEAENVRLRDALENFVAANEPNGYPLWFNRQIYPKCQDCDGEDLCAKHWHMASTKFVGCQAEVDKFIKENFGLSARAALEGK